MKPKIIQVRGVVIERIFDFVTDELLDIFNNIHTGNWKVTEELNFLESYKSGKRGCHFDVFLGETGTIIFRPFHYIDGLDDWCYFNLKHYSERYKNAIEFYQWSSKREGKLELWKDGQNLVTASQKKSIRVKGDKSLIKNKDVYESINFYIRNIVGLNVEDLTVNHKIYRCER